MNAWSGLSVGGGPLAGIFSENNMPEENSTATKEPTTEPTTEQRIEAMSIAAESLESMVGICDTLLRKVARIAQEHPNMQGWPPIMLLHSAATMCQQEFQKIVDGTLDTISNMRRESSRTQETNDGEESTDDR